jgi:hypothetical protein
MINTEAEFLMEVTNKTKEDVQVSMSPLYNPSMYLLLVFRLERWLIMTAQCILLNLFKFRRSTRKSSNQV